MAIYRTVQMSFWTDAKVVDDFTPEDRYFYLYVLTNPHTNLSGCYEISIKQMSDETGYSKETVENLLGRFSDTHKILSYSKATKEICVYNYHKFNWRRSHKLAVPISKEINAIKNLDFKAKLAELFVEYFKELDTISISYPYGMDITVTVTVNNNIKDSSNTKDSNTNNNLTKDIIDYLNDKTGKRFSPTTKATVEHINGRISEGYTWDDFKKVIDNKVAEWGNSEMDKFLRPNTLFAPSHFEEYLNQGNQQGGEQECESMNQKSGRRWQ